MRILVANDDGILAPGLKLLAEALATIGEVTVVAPERERSAVSHAISLIDPLRAWPVPFAGVAAAYAISGTPADCVLIGARELMPEPPDVVVSGINRGANLGEDIWYSGTVAAAKEGALLGFPALAFSVCCGADEPRFEAAAEYALRLVPPAVERLPAGTLLNVNTPNLPPEQIAGVEVCRQGRRGYYTLFDKRQDPRGRDYYWIGTGDPVDEPVAGTDLAAIAAGRVAVTPVRLELTDDSLLAPLTAWIGNGRPAT